MQSELMDGLVAAVPIPLVLVGADGRVGSVNAAATALLGPGIEGRNHMTVLRAPALIDCVETTSKTGAATVARHVALDRQGNDTVWRVRAEPLSTDAGRMVLVSFEDRTEFEAASQMRRDFVANVSHELKTPLTALMGFIETLRGAARDDAAARERFLAIMEREASRMNRLVSDLLSLNRVESEERVRPTARVDLRATLNAVFSTLRPMAEDRGVRLEITGWTGEAVVQGDADQLTQVFANLTENALKYAASGKLVTVNLVREDRELAFGGPGIRVEVIDRGDGFDPVHIPRLTERFYRIDGHRSREEGGTGLGLAIVKHIVNRHRGRLKIESAPGQGSRFTVILPLV
jgi:two-component system phosphate regulon sensor histidine kinase PhoR